MAANRLKAIERLIIDALGMADVEKEHLIGALLDEALHVVRKRLEDTPD